MYREKELEVEHVGLEIEHVIEKKGYRTYVVELVHVLENVYDICCRIVLENGSNI